ncbi:hypothetical protein CRENBAI_020640 [Crenichthys baileyi]|uniref:Uncharacterized protein n=1 Tax=Crenichthys baileyi TaxID=28760 RepID=A0AAV9RTQ7_9TELE
MVLLKLLSWHVNIPKHSSSSSGTAMVTWARESRDYMDEATAGLGDVTVADKSVGNLVAAVPAADMGTSPSEVVRLETLRTSVFCGRRKTWALLSDVEEEKRSDV